MSAANVPAPGFRTWEGKDRPYLPAHAVALVADLRRRGYRVPPRAVDVLHSLCDLVEASHGQFYGSWENFIRKYGLARSFFFRGLAELKELGLVEELGRLGGRTTRWQVLPHLYRDTLDVPSVSDMTHKALESHIRDTSDVADNRPPEPEDVLAQSQIRDSHSLTSDTPLVSHIGDLLVSQEWDTNIRTSSEHQTSTSPHVAATQRDDEDLEERRQRTKAALAAWEAQTTKDPPKKSS